MNIPDYEGAILALACWRESRDGTVESMLCIGNTIVNLATLQEIGTGEAIVQHRLLHGLLGDGASYPDTRDPMFCKLLRRIDDITSQYHEDLTNGAIYYIDLSKEVPAHMKFLLNSPEEHPMCAVSGSRHFFK
jgi:hypothetical protein